MAKSKLPDLQEVTQMAGKLFNAVKSGVCEIIDDYKSKRQVDEEAEAPKAKKTPEKQTKAEKSEKHEKHAKHAESQSHHSSDEK